MQNNQRTSGALDYFSVAGSDGTSLCRDPSATSGCCFEKQTQNSSFNIIAKNATPLRKYSILRNALLLLLFAAI